MNDRQDSQPRRQTGNDRIRTVDSNDGHHNNDGGRRRDHNHRHRGGGRGGQNSGGGGQRFLGNGGASEETTIRRGPGDSDRRSVVGFALERPQEHQYDSIQRHGQRHNGGSRRGRCGRGGRFNSRFQGGHNRSHQNGGGRGVQMQQPMTSANRQLEQPFSYLSLRNAGSYKKNFPTLQSALTEESSSSPSSSSHASTATPNSWASPPRIQAEPTPQPKTTTPMTSQDQGTSGLNFPPTTPATFSIDYAKGQWSAGREKPRVMKIRTLDFLSRPAVGGDVIVDRKSAHVTLSFTFKKNGKKFGLTVGHLDFLMLDDPIFMYVGRLPSGMLCKDVVGKVVAIGKDTDSMIFQFFDNIPIYPLAVAVCGGGGDNADDCKVHKIRLEDTERLFSARTGHEIMAFGASRRGLTGVFVEHIDELNERGAAAKGHLDDVRTASYDEATQTAAKDVLTEVGDCGAIYLDKTGAPILIHVAISIEPNEIDPLSYFSIAQPLHRVLDEHHEYFEGWCGSRKYKRQSSPSHQRMFSVSFDREAGVHVEDAELGPIAKAYIQPGTGASYVRDALRQEDTGLEFELGPIAKAWEAQQKMKRAQSK